MKEPRLFIAPGELERLEGLFVGQLDPSDMAVFEQAVEDGLAFRSYEGGPGFMGLAKVRLPRKS